MVKWYLDLAEQEPRGCIIGTPGQKFPGDLCFFSILLHPGDLRSWESPQTLPALFIGPFERVEGFRNLKFAV